MAKYTAKDWEDVRKRFHSSIMADTSLSSLAQNLDIADWPVKGDEERPSKYIDFNYEELLMLPEIAGSEKRVDHLVGILKETLAFDDPFGDMVAQVEESSSKENAVLKTLGRLGIPEAYPLALVNVSEGTRAVCASEGVKTIGEFANLAQQMSTRVVIGGDFRGLLNALSHGDEEGIGQFLPFRKGASGLHLPEALGLAAAAVGRSEQAALAKAYGATLTGTEAGATVLSAEAQAQAEQRVQLAMNATFDWFKDATSALVAKLNAGGSLERELVVLGDPVREAVAARFVRTTLAAKLNSAAATMPAAPKKGGLFSRLFGR
ncbi:MAG: hypothetical protein KF715_02040 [Candidatus Didemnitutus sp.]|nr:hypothetical protein [Candidatus Didemnitutus sp.]